MSGKMSGSVVVGRTQNVGVRIRVQVHQLTCHSRVRFPSLAPLGISPYSETCLTLSAAWGMNVVTIFGQGWFR